MAHHVDIVYGIALCGYNLRVHFLQDIVLSLNLARPNCHGHQGRALTTLLPTSDI